jgi:hypothetical protein
VAYNDKAGIFHEISYDAIIRGNTAVGNGDLTRDGGGLWGAGILISGSPNVEVYNNIVTNNQNGITGIQQGQKRGSGAYGPHHLKNLWVHHNTITMTERGQTGISDNGTGDPTVFSQNNRFDYNTYDPGARQNYFAWKGAVTAVEWRGLGHDANGIWSSN